MCTWPRVTCSHSSNAKTEKAFTSLPNSNKQHELNWNEAISKTICFKLKKFMQFVQKPFFSHFGKKKTKTHIFCYKLNLFQKIINVICEQCLYNTLSAHCGHAITSSYSTNNCHYPINLHNHTVASNIHCSYFPRWSCNLLNFNGWYEHQHKIGLQEVQRKNKNKTKVNTYINIGNAMVNIRDIAKKLQLISIRTHCILCWLFKSRSMNKKHSLTHCVMVYLFTQSIHKRMPF